MENRQFTRPFVKIQALNDNFYEGEITQESLEKLDRLYFEQALVPLLEPFVEGHELEGDEIVTLEDMVVDKYGSLICFMENLAEGYEETLEVIGHLADLIVEDRRRVFVVPVTFTYTLDVPILASSADEARDLAYEYEDEFADRFDSCDVVDFGEKDFGWACEDDSYSEEECFNYDD